MKKTMIIAQTLIFGGKEILNIIKITASIKYWKKKFFQLVKSGAATRV